MGAEGEEGVPVSTSWRESIIAQRDPASWPGVGVHQGLAGMLRLDWSGT